MGRFERAIAWPARKSVEILCPAAVYSARGFKNGTPNASPQSKFPYQIARVSRSRDDGAIHRYARIREGHVPASDPEFVRSRDHHRAVVLRIQAFPIHGWAGFEPPDSRCQAVDRASRQSGGHFRVRTARSYSSDIVSAAIACYTGGSGDNGFFPGCAVSGAASPHPSHCNFASLSSPGQRSLK